MNTEATENRPGSHRIDATGESDQRVPETARGDVEPVLIEHYELGGPSGEYFTVTSGTWSDDYSVRTIHSWREVVGAEQAPDVEMLASCRRSRVDCCTLLGMCPRIAGRLGGGRMSRTHPRSRSGMGRQAAPIEMADGRYHESPETILGSKIQPLPSGCWAFRDSLDRRAHTSGRLGSVTVYRFVYETLVGPIDEDHILHHHCENPGCCNPAHLEPMTQSDHQRLHAALRRKASCGVQ